MKFSQRIGKTPSIKDLKIESIDKDLLYGLWNLSKIYVIDNISTRGSGRSSKSTVEQLINLSYKFNFGYGQTENNSHLPFSLQAIFNTHSR